MALEPVSREEALRRVPDGPTTIEARAIALSPRGRVLRSDEGLVIVHPDHRLVCALGAVRADDVDALFDREQFECELVADRTAYERLKDTRDFERALLHRLGQAWHSRPHTIAELSIRPLTLDDRLDALPEELREEIIYAREHFHVLAGVVDGRPVSFAYDEGTETLSDLSIDTLESHRNRGIGTAVAAAAVGHVVARGMTPVWGALASNAASLRLAAKLGFDQIVGELFVWEEE
ncbi:MAG: GNAT family N-acetyltransferase [Planctomycetota bacterium]|nr:MAG: GNAT family N-acetyltransferase [Planctomycetota bacterium]